MLSQVELIERICVIRPVILIFTLDILDLNINGIMCQRMKQIKLHPSWKISDYGSSFMAMILLVVDVVLCVGATGTFNKTMCSMICIRLESMMNKDTLISCELLEMTSISM
jgi:hypothetical protein